MRIFVNPVCNYGEGRRVWSKIAPAICRHFGKFEAEEIESPENFRGQVGAALSSGERFLVAAGGDGTVNLLLNALVENGTSGGGLILGAIGLGSSNDFHKPFRAEAFVEGVPVRLNRRDAIVCDVITARYEDKTGCLQDRHGLINMSVGITAEANALYNSRARSVELAKKISQEAAVIMAALETIARYRNFAARLTLDGQVRSVRITNLGLIKSPHFAGGLCYDTRIRPDDGWIGVNLCHDMTKWEAVQALFRLYRKDFSGRPKTNSWFAREIELGSDTPFALEVDGEIVTAKRARFSVIPRHMRCCR